MPDDRSDTDGLDDFAGAMQLLASQAAAKTPSGTGNGNGARNDMLLDIGRLIRPLAKELEDLRAKNDDQNRMLTALGKTLSAQGGIGPAMESIREQMSRLGSVESANQKLFDALHAELKGYKDNFLFDALQKPYITNLVSLFDDLWDVHHQMRRRLETAHPDAASDHEDAAFLRTLAGNVENQVHHMIEVFLRMDVTITETRPGAPVDKKAHRVVSFEPASLPAEDNVVHRSLKRGFLWRDRMIRAEDVVARRWTPPPPGISVAPPRLTQLVSAPPAAAQAAPPPDTALSAT